MTTDRFFLLALLALCLSSVYDSTVNHSQIFETLTKLIRP